MAFTKAGPEARRAAAERNRERQREDHIDLVKRLAEKQAADHGYIWDEMLERAIASNSEYGIE